MPKGVYPHTHIKPKVYSAAPQVCVACGSANPERRYEWANLTGAYEKIADYIRLCVPCHRRFDAHRRAVTGERTSPDRRSA